MKKLLFILLLSWNASASLDGFPVVFGLSYSYFWNYNYSYNYSIYDDRHFISVLARYPIIKDIADIGLQAGYDIGPIFRENKTNMEWSGMQVLRDTSIAQYEDIYHIRRFANDIGILAPITFHIQSFLLELGANVDLIFTKYESRDTTIWSYLNGGVFVPYDTTTYDNRSIDFYIGDFIHYAVGYQWKSVQIELTGRGVYYIGISVRYLINEKKRI
jgi:hypothetical protein